MTNHMVISQGERPIHSVVAGGGFPCAVQTITNAAHIRRLIAGGFHLLHSPLQIFACGLIFVVGFNTVIALDMDIIQIFYLYYIRFKFVYVFRLLYGYVIHC